MDDTDNRDAPEAKASAKPSHIAYHVRENENGKAFFNRVGSAFAHKDGKGFSVLLDSTPVDGTVTLRTMEDRMKAAKDGTKGQDQGQER